MLTLPLIFIIAVAIAFIAAIPVGAVNMAVVQATLNEGRKAAYLIGTGAILVEALYCGIPLFGFSYIFEQDSLAMDLLFLISIPILVAFGIVTILNRKAIVIKAAQKENQRGPGGKILYGITLCITNPMIIFFWAQVSSALHKFDVISHDISQLITFLLGVPAGTFLLYLLLVWIVSKRKRNVDFEMRAKINLVVGYIFIGLAVYLLFHYLRLKHII